MILYQTQEKAFAPGIVQEWPKFIPHPTDINGRLVRIELNDLELLQAYRLAFSLLSLRQKQSILKVLHQLKDGSKLVTAIDLDRNS